MCALPLDPTADFPSSPTPPPHPGSHPPELAGVLLKEAPPFTLASKARRYKLANKAPKKGPAPVISDSSSEDKH